MSNNDHSNDFINIVGPNHLQNELLVQYFETKLDNALCSSSSKLGLNTSPPAVSPKNQVILLDCAGQNHETPWSEVDLQISSNKKVFFAIFNLPIKTTDENSFLARGFRGIFFENTPVEILCKGTGLILKGELWYSRETMSRFLTKQHSMYNQQDNESASAMLTAREREILIKLASGASNKDIASFLCISTHTVKTHLYNLYKKINVPNRLQAALWVAKYL